MKNVTYASRSLLIGDEAADLLVEYAAALADATRADAVSLHAIGAAGEEIEATLLLDNGAVLMVETTDEPVTEPDNGGPVRYMRDRIRKLARSAATSHFTPDDLRNVDTSTLD